MSYLSLDEDLFELDNQLTGPKNTVDTVIVSDILDLIKNNLELLDKYNTLRSYLLQLHKDNLLFILDDISDSCTESVGELQGLLKIFQPNAENIDKGADEVLKMV